MFDKILIATVARFAFACPDPRAKELGHRDGAVYSNPPRTKRAFMVKARLR